MINRKILGSRAVRKGFLVLGLISAVALPNPAGIKQRVFNHNSISEKEIQLQTQKLTRAMQAPLKQVYTQVVQPVDKSQAERIRAESKAELEKLGLITE